MVVLLARIVMTFLFDFDIRKVLKNNNHRYFYCVSLLNIFAIIGIFSTNNIFNLFIYIEIFCLTLASIMAISDDIEICKLSFRYFFKSAFASILLLVSFILLYVLSGSFKISEISNLSNIQNIDLIFWVVVISVFLKFFSFGTYFGFLKSRDSMTNFLSCLSFIVGGLVGLYLLLKFALFLFHPEGFFFYSLAFIGFCLVFYASYKIIKTSHLKGVMIYFSLMNLGLAASGIGLFEEKALQPSLIYISNCMIVGIALFIAVRIMHNKSSDSHLSSISNLIKDDLTGKNLIQKLFWAFTIFILTSFPASFVFWANFQLVILALNLNISSFLIVPIITTNLATSKLIVNFLSGHSPKMKLF
jgi:multicomponent Na+:H+ antiporter subunit D